MSRSLTEIVGGICSVRDYFIHFAKEQPLFLPELTVANEIVSLIQSGATDEATRGRVIALLEAPLEAHYDGTGWHHFKSLVREWVEASEESTVEPRRQP